MSRYIEGFTFHAQFPINNPIPMFAQIISDVLHILLRGFDQYLYEIIGPINNVDDSKYCCLYKACIPGIKKHNEEVIK